MVAPRLLLVAVMALAAGCTSTRLEPSLEAERGDELVTTPTAAPPVLYVPRRAVGVINPTGRLTG